MSHSIRLAAIAVTLAVALTGTGCSGGPARSAKTAPQREDPNAAPGDITRMINCYRAHGLPNYPDPTYDPADGQWHLANQRPALTAAIRQACASVMPEATPASPIPTAQLTDLLNFAKCVRAHGVPGWPDPGVDGTFRSDNVLDVKRDPGTRAAVQACQQYLASSGGNISVGEPNG